MVEIYGAFFVSDALALFVEAVARTRTVGQVPYGVLGRTFATVKKKSQFFVCLYSLAPTYTQTGNATSCCYLIILNR